MVAKINIGSSLFGALSYNQKKMDEGTGRVLCSNKMTENADGNFNIHTCMRDFENQMPSDVKTEKTIIHISLNPHPDDKLTDEQLLAIAEEYMSKLGYGNQPYIVYKHEDIDRHHIHIVSLRVDEQGRKIDDRFEHRRSKDITRTLEQKYGLKSAEKQQRPDTLAVKKVAPKVGDVKKQISNIIKHVVAQYYCSTFNEYRALLSLYNVYAEEVKGEAKGKPYNGVVYSATDDKGNKVGNPFKSSLFGKSVGYEALYKKIEDSKEAIKKGQFVPQTKRRAIEALHRSTSKSKFHKRAS